MTGPRWGDFTQLASAPVTVTIRGEVRSIDTAPIEVLSYEPPDQWRIEDGAGNLCYLANETGHYQWPRGGGPLACFQPRQPGVWRSGGMTSPSLIKPRDLVHPQDDDFTRPAGPVEELTFLGRRAWRVLLAPPPRKPQPVWQILDVASGVTLAYQTPDGVGVVEFTTISTNLEFPPETFAEPS